MDLRYFSSKHKLGILGGGQLGKMMLYNTRKFDINTSVLDPNNEAPSRLACNHFVQGDLMDFETVFNFGKKVDTLTIEIENVNVEALKALEKKGVKVYPDSNTLATIQNKAEQKRFYIKHQLPTAAFKAYNNKSTLEMAVSENVQSLPFVWKSARFGYDGNGVKIIRKHSDLDQLPNGECIAEDLIPFKNELAVIVARNPKGEIKSYPVVEMEFHPEANQVEYVLCPARIPESVAKKATDVALKTAAAFQHVGLLAVEMFLTQNDDILINEVAPRPHNSGHQTIEASQTSQFEQHLRAILNLPLGSTKNKACGVMVNLVGAEGHQGAVVYKNIEAIMALEGVTPHIYGKKMTRPFRKMGHVTIVNSSIEKARKIAQKVKESINVISE
ncbi:MAG: 5-(carboxyamino)imidazole ribonucleotide synthase [Formosa sp.]|nr:5-(carboxyamino)imidazole ribonucleotide synthase [Formosa sp.]MAH20506.1 5-(carboxyamino)imidazole ribonucleotide synthase [Flavobacteriaceae bacterium]